MQRSPWEIFSTILAFLGMAALGTLAQQPPAQTEPPSAPAQSETPPASKPFPPAKIREALLAEASPNSEVTWARSTTNHLAWVEKAGGQRTAHLDGKPLGGSYDDIKYLKFSEDEQHVAFVAKRKSKWVLVLDGEERSREYGRMTAPALSANGKTFAICACVEKQCRLVVDNAEVGPAFEDISAPGFTSDGTHHLYFGKRNKKWIMVLDDKESGPEMDDFVDWEFSPEGVHSAVAALMKRKWTWIVDGTPGPAFDVVGSIAFSPDNKHFAYAGADEKSGFGKHATHGSLVVDGKVAQTYDGRGFGGGWAAVFGPQESMVTGLRSLSPDFHGLSDPSYSSDGKLTYAARRGENDVVVFMDTAPGPAFEDIVSPIVITADARHTFYVAKRGESFVEVHDQSAGASFPGKREVSFVGGISISRDGRHTAYEIVRGGKMFKAGSTNRALRRLVLDSQANPEYDALGLRDYWFSDTGKHFAYLVVGAEGQKDRVIFDGLEGKLYDSVFLHSLKSIDDSTIEFVAQDGRRFLRVTQSLD